MKTKRGRVGKVTMEAELGAIWAQAKECWCPPKADRGKGWFSPGAFRSVALLAP